MMSVAAGWKVISQGCGWAAWADAPAKTVAAAAALARNFLIALIISHFLAAVCAGISNSAGTGIPDSPKAGSNHTLIASARKERRKPCGIFARKCGYAFQTAKRPLPITGA
ncbi:hypothetical protein MesoLj131a_50820 [Mesorhizobium sp. 131-2-1]|nr:hypothetical protein MesoLj131a_50820 [Mesorhizobium sp. 131-2-1]